MEKVKDVVSSLGLVLADVGEKLGIPNLDPTSGTIFITGGTGVVGYRVATRLLRAGYPTVRLGVHHPDVAEELGKEGAEIADFRWDNDATYEKALQGVKSVFCTAPYVANWDEKFPLFLEACEAAGVKHFVKLSFYHARRSNSILQSVPLVKAHGQCDQMLADSGLAYTILSASHFMSNPLLFQGKELRSDQKPAAMYGSSRGRGVNYVSPNDVAEVAVRVLLEPKTHYDKEYTLTGPYAMTDQVVASLLSKHLKKPVEFVDQPLHVFEEGEKAGGDPEWLIEDLVALEKIKATGLEEQLAFVSHDFEKVCGHKAESYEGYLDHKEYMTRAEVA
ncbi:NmrA-like family [Fragilaria crotonensis]|nr:NmrA-like family [Fragilaria crotonensis]